MVKSDRKFKEAGKLFSEPEDVETPVVDEAKETKKREEKAKREANKQKHGAHHDLSHAPGSVPDKKGYRSRK